VSERTHQKRSKTALASGSEMGEAKLVDGTV